MTSLITVILCASCLWAPVYAANSPTVNDNFDYDRLQPDHLSPVIVTEPVTINPHPGETVTLDCHVTRLGNHSLTWRRGSDIISVFRGRNQQRVLKDRRYLPTIANLTLFNVVGSDSGPYTCEVTTRPNPTTLTHTVNVYEGPTITATHPRLTPKEGGTATLECSFTGYPPPTVTWSRHDHSSPAAPPLLSSRTEGSISELVLTNVTRDDTGSYMCSAFSSFGPSSNATMDLTTMHAPTVTVEDPVVHTGVGLNAVLMCRVSAYPSVKVKWHHADTGAPVDPMRLKRQHRRKDRWFLLFSPVLLRDLGSYVCVASNQLGTDQGQVTLSALPKSPVVVSDTHSNFTTEYMLLWEVESYAPILHYVINIRNATDPEEASLNITVPGYRSQYASYHSQKKEFTNLQPNSKYIVDILAFNEFGENSLGFPFTFQTAREDKVFPDVAILDPDQQGSESSLEEDYEDGAYEDTYNHGADYEGGINYNGGGGGAGTGGGGGVGGGGGGSGGGDGESGGVDGGGGGEGDGVGEKRKKPHRHHHRLRQQHKERGQTPVNDEDYIAELAPEQQQQRGSDPDEDTEQTPGDDTAVGNSSLLPTDAASPAPPTLPSYPGLGAWLTVIVLSAFFC